MSEKENAGKSPQIYAGNQYYQQLMKTMDCCRQAMIAGDYQTWVSLLRQFLNWTSDFIKDKDVLRKDIKALQSRADSIHGLLRESSFRGVSHQKLNALRNDIFDAEDVLFSKAQPLLLRLENVEDDSFDWDEILSKT